MHDLHELVALLHQHDDLIKWVGLSVCVTAACQMVRTLLEFRRPPK